MLTLHTFPDHQAVSEHAAQWLAQRLREKPDALLCLATGATPVAAYQRLAELAAAEPSLAGRFRLLNLDEWGGLAADDPASCARVLEATLIGPLELRDRYVGFDGLASDPQSECARIGSWLERHGPIDFCVLGLGVNGHLGFNEPADELQPHAHVAELSQASLSHGMIRQSAVRPPYGLTLGITDLMASRRVLVLVTGPAKRAPMGRLLSGRITTQFPASLLNLHPDAELACDKAAMP